MWLEADSIFQPGISATQKADFSSWPKLGNHGEAQTCGPLKGFPFLSLEDAAWLACKYRIPPLFHQHQPQITNPESVFRGLGHFGQGLNLHGPFPDRPLDLTSATKKAHMNPSDTLMRLEFPLASSRLKGWVSTLTGSFKIGPTYQTVEGSTGL